MDFGMILPRVDPGARPMTARTLPDAAQRLERLGFTSAWITDSIGRGFANPDPLTALAVAAAVTTDLRLGTGILQVPIRNPVELAQRVMTTHLLAGDRLRLGIGVGSAQTDFTATGSVYERRFKEFEESVTLMRRLWRNETVEGICISPWEATLGGPSLLIGSWAGSRWVPRAAREFDGWIASVRKTSWKQIEEGIRRYRGAGGRHAVALNLVVDFELPDGRDSDDEPLGACGPEIAKARIDRLRELGFDEVVLRTQDHTDEVIGRLADLVR
jgi:alkanesulfonate monooxygenase SsuD/methylene tetrahydromethanopterin reductase-like flavin-dependent oxidoreductase (luciferase family)